MQDDDKPLEARIEVYDRFGSFMRSFVAAFELLLGNWAVPLKVMQDNVDEGYSVVLILFVCFGNFAMVQVIRAVFIHETFRAAGEDEEFLIMQKERQAASFAENMHRFFAEANALHGRETDFITFEDFMEISKDPRMHTWLAALDLTISDASLAFDLLADGD